MIHGVHRHASDDGPPSQPPVSAGAPQLAVLMLRIGEAADCGHAPFQDQTLLAGWKPDSHVAALICAACFHVAGQNGIEDAGSTPQRTLPLRKKCVYILL